MKFRLSFCKSFITNDRLKYALVVLISIMARCAAIYLIATTPGLREIMVLSGHDSSEVYLPRVGSKMIRY